MMKTRGFPECFISWDCKHYFWKICLVEIQGQHKEKLDNNTLVMEVISDPFSYIWYFNFGYPCSLNDIDILDRSIIISALMTNTFDLKVSSYEIDGLWCDWMYFLIDGIYSSWRIFMKSNHTPTNKIELKFTENQSLRILSVVLGQVQYP